MEKIVEDRGRLRGSRLIGDLCSLVLLREMHLALFLVYTVTVIRIKANFTKN
jgi:hypothetical protein